MRPGILVTGASAGIGLATADRLLAQGFAVTGLSRTIGGGEDLAERYGGAFRWRACDLTDAAAAQSTAEEAVDGLGEAFAVVCCAGSGVFGSVEDTHDDVAVAQLDVNYHGVVRTIRAALPALRNYAAGQGRIVVVGSLAGRAPIPFQAHYSASKAALDAFTLALAGEVTGLGVAVSLIEPGDINTRFNDVMRWVRPSSPYASRSASVEAVVRSSVDAGPRPERVVDAIVRALTASRPRLRYRVGPGRWAVPAARRLLPDRVNVSLLRRHFDLVRVGAG